VESRDKHGHDDADDGGGDRRTRRVKARQWVYRRGRLHPLRELVIETQHLDLDDMRQLMARLPALESLVATWTVRRGAVIG